MDINRFTERSQEALRDAQRIASRFYHQGMDVEHLLLALLALKDGTATAALEGAGAKAAIIQERLQQALERAPKVSGPAAGPDQIYVTQRLNRIITAAEDEAKA